MFRYLLVFLLLPGTYCAQAQLAQNMSLLGQWDDDTLPLRYDGAYMDIWGYAANGREYAIISTVQSVYFFDVTNPSNLVEIAHFDGGSDSGWRDVKTFGNYAYAVSDEGTEGMMIFDLSNLPATVTKVAQVTNFFSTAHNIFIDEPNARLYAAGTNTKNNGMWVLDLSADPANPSLLSAANLPGGYVHDVYVRNNIAWCSHLTTGLYVYNYSNPSFPILIGELDNYVPSVGLNHSSWLNSSGTHLVFAEETHGRPLYIADVTNIAEMEITDQFSSSLLGAQSPGSIAHNPFILGDLCFVSYYHDGVHIFDISDPKDVQRVAYYDTYTGHSDYTYYYGAWGVYPYLPSGNILVSDLLEGLYVLQLDATVLPVSWVSFTAERKASGVQLDWTTAAERDNAGFWVQRRSEHGVFRNLFFVAAQEGSTEQRTYQAIDDDAPSGECYYRLRQVDVSGEESYSTIVSVGALTEAADQWRVYPNVLAAGAELSIEGPLETLQAIHWVDAEGKSIGQSAFNQSIISVPGTIPAGAYFLRLLTKTGNWYTVSVQIR